MNSFVKEAATLPDYNREVGKQPRPYVVFDLRPKEVRDGNGGSSFVDEPWACVTSAGSKDTLEKPAKDWIASLDQQVAMGRVPASWPSEYKQALAQWMHTQEMPLHGTPIKTWEGVTPAQRKRLLSVNILTVEDLAVANEEMIANIGMGARDLKRIAESYLADKTGPGALARELAAMQVRLGALEARNEELEVANAGMKAILPKAESQNEVTGQVSLTVDA